MKVIDDDDDFFSSTLIDEIALMLPCCQKLLPWISVTGPRHSGSRLYNGDNNDLKPRLCGASKKNLESIELEATLHPSVDSSCSTVYNL